MEWLSDSYFINFSVIICFVLSLIYYLNSNYDYWKKLGVPYLQPLYPFVGNSYAIMFSLKSFVEDQLDTYNYFKGKPFGGFFRFTQPSLFLRDPKLIETVLIKDFANFYNRGAKVDTELDPLSAHLVHLENAEWKGLRNKLTPTFSSGKLKGMHQQLIECSNVLMKHMSEFVDGESFEAKEMMSKFTIDVIASCAFGLNTNALTDPDSEFKIMGQTVFRISFMARLRALLRGQYPRLLRLLAWKSLPENVENFFIGTIYEALEYREKNKIQRPDFLHLMNELRKQDQQAKSDGQLNENDLVFTDKLMVANAFVFFAAGFETTASTLSYALYELAVNQDIQEKVYQEVIESIKKQGNEPTFEAVKAMIYLEQVVSETLRKYPLVTSISREVTKPYKLPGTSVILPKSMLVMVPIFALHHDPELFPDPEKFVPERFSEENQSKIKKGSYLPFGDGPRICIGLRFARLEIKVAISKILMNYKVSLNAKTISPLKFKKFFFLNPIGGIWIDLHNRV